MKKIKIGISIAILILGAGILWWQLENKTGIEAKENQIAYQPPAAVASKPPINVNTTQSSPPAIPLPLPPVKESLLTTFDDLKKLADAGDRKASCRLGLELVRCKWHNGYVAAHKKNIEILAAMSKDDAKYSQTARQNQNFERLIARDKSVCAGFPMESTTDGWRYVFAAASAGDGYSAVKFAQGMSLLSPTEPRPLDTAEGWVAYRQNAFPMLEQALEQGHPQAALILSRFHRAPQFGSQLAPKDPIKSIAYLMAIKSIAASEFKEQLAVEIEDHLESSKLTAAERMNAESLAILIASKFRNVPKDGVDFRNNLFERNDGSECR